MGDPIYSACLDSLTFGVETSIGYYDFSCEAARENTADRKAEGGKAISKDWINGDSLMRKLVQLSSISGTAPRAQHAAEEQLIQPQVIFLVVWGLPRNRALAIRKDHFLGIMDKCHFPKTFPQTLCEKTGHFALLTDFEDEETPGWISVVIKTPHSAANFSFVLRTRISDRSTVCLLIIQDDQMLARILDRLYAHRLMLQKAPLQIITILCEEYGQRNEAWREDLDLSIVTMEHRIVMTGFDIDTFDESISKDEPLIRNLHKTNTNLTWLEFTTNFELKLLEFSREAIELCETLREEQSLTTLSRRCRINIAQAIKSLVNSCTNRGHHVRGLQDRAKVQISTLSSQISQRDSRINLSTAKDSKDIARSTLQDGKAVKTISVLGLVFLPATLIASIYGAGIFDFHSDGVIVSSLWWTYAVATIGLTILVLILWGIYIRQSNKLGRSKTEDKWEKGWKMA